MVEYLTTLAVLFMIGGLYFFPTIMASVNKRKQVMAIFLVNLIFGWTGIGWIIALIWCTIED